MLANAPRPSESSLTIYERSESMNLLFLLEFMGSYPQNFLFFIFKYIFKYFYVRYSPCATVLSDSISTPIPIYKYTNSVIKPSISTPIPIYKYTNSDIIDTYILEVYKYTHILEVYKYEKGTCCKR